MVSRPKVLVSWSTGKDAAYALWVLQQRGEVEITGLLTTVREPSQTVTMHEVGLDLLKAQADATGLPLRTLHLPWPCPNEQYARIMGEAMEEARAEGIETVAFGDVFLEDVRRYREESLARVGMKACFPLWGRPTAALVREMLDAGLRARIACVDTKKVPASFAGRELDQALLDELPEDVDPCGERGELHSFVWDGPMFRHPIAIEARGIVHHDDFARAELRLR